MDRFRRDRQREPRPARVESLERAFGFQARELMTEAEMDAGTEGNVPVGFSRQIQLFRLRVRHRIHVRARKSGSYLIATFELHTTQINILAHVAWLRELHRAYETKEFLNGEVGTAPVRSEPVAQCGIFRQLENRPADQVRRRLMPGKQKQEDRRNHLIARNRRTFLFDRNELSNQPCAVALARMLQLPLQIAAHRHHGWEHAQERIALLALVARAAHPMNFGRSVSGSPSSSQMTDTGSRRA